MHHFLTPILFSLLAAPAFLAAATISVEDLPAHSQPALLLSADQKNVPDGVLQVKLPTHSKILYVQKSGAPAPSLLTRLRQAGNQVATVTANKGARGLIRVAEHLKPDILLLPLGFDDPGLATEARLAVYYSWGEPWGNQHLPLAHLALEKKAEAMSRFHCSQNKRTDFAAIVHASAEEDLMREPYVFPDGIALDFEAGDVVIIAAPHPDDAEIGTGGLIQKLGQQGIRTIVWNVTTGHRSQIKKQDVIRAPHFSPKLKRDIILSRDDILQDSDLKTRIRQEESEGSLRFLNGRVEVEHLALPFYDAPQYTYGVKDKRSIAQHLEKPSKDHRRVFLFTPWPEDEHPAHRVTTDLVREQARKFHNVFVCYYKTPWTGNFNLYDYHNGKRGRLAALVGGERLMGKGEAALTAEVLGGARADRYLVTFLLP